MLTFHNVWRFLRSHKIDLAARMSWCESKRPELYGQSRRCCWPLCRPARGRPLCCAWTKSLRSRLWSERRLSEVAQWPRLDRPEPRLQAAWHDKRCLRRSKSATGKDHSNAFKTPSPVEFLDFMNSVTTAFPEPQASRHPRQPQHPQKERALAQGPSQCAISFHADKRLLAQSGRGMVFDLAGAVA